MSCASACHSSWHSLEGFVTGKKKAAAVEIQEKAGDTTTTIVNPEYVDWLAADQQVLSFTLASVTKEVLVRIATVKTPADAWKILEEHLASQTRAHAINVHIALTTTCKGNSSVAKYLTKMQSLGNDMATAGRPLDDEDLIQYILTGLDEDYDSVVNSILARPQPILVSELAS
jgi:hypothetical protein